MRYTEDNRGFFMQSADDIAPQLLGKIICRNLPEGQGKLRFRITETEAYCHDDSACYGYGYKGNHGSKNKTSAIAPLFEEGGKCCVYAGMLLIVCGEENVPDNVLIRKAGNRDTYCDGPFLLGKALKIDQGLHGKDMLMLRSIRSRARSRQSESARRRLPRQP
jgi:3-methyladenine DNA glycosylase Mpg